MMKNILLVLLLTITATANAAFINLGQTSLDDSTNLEWLNFSNLTGGDNQLMTMGYSINDSLTTFGAGNGNFRLASASEVQGLFGSLFPSFLPASNGIMTFPGVNGATGIFNERDAWLHAFGTDANATDPGTTFTLNPDGSTTRVTTSGNLSSRGMYLDDLGNVQYAGVLLKVSDASTKIYGPNFATGASLNEDSAFGNFGVFMVREYEVSTVPVPAAAWLMLSGLLGLVGVARRKV